MFSFPPENLITWVVPAFFGDTVHFPYWGRWYLWEMSLFVSVTGFLLAVYAVVFRQGRERFIPAAMAGILLLLAMGSYLPWFGLLHAYLPGFDTFRGVSKFIFQATLFMILLSAMGLDSLIRDGLRKRWQVLAALGVAASLSLIIGLSIRQSARAASGLWADIMRAYRRHGRSLSPAGVLRKRSGHPEGGRVCRPGPCRSCPPLAPSSPPSCSCGYRISGSPRFSSLWPYSSSFRRGVQFIIRSSLTRRIPGTWWRCSGRGPANTAS